MSRGEVVEIDQHPDFESEAVSRARGRLMRLACELPPRAVFELLRHAEDAARTPGPREGEVVPFRRPS